MILACAVLAIVLAMILALALARSSARADRLAAELYARRRRELAQLNGHPPELRLIDREA